jgi:hypothetical protein
MKISRLFLLMALFLVACGLQTPISTPSHTSTPTTSHTISPTPVPATRVQPTRTTTLTLVPTISPTTTPAPYVPPQREEYEQPWPYPFPPTEATKEPKPSKTPVIPSPTSTLFQTKPTTPLDRKSLESILAWVEYGLAQSDINVFDILSWEKIAYGPCHSEWTGSFTKQEFLEELQIRLPRQPKCVTYLSREGAINIISITTTGWDPAWVVPGFGDEYLYSTCIKLDFSDQLTKDVGYTLRGICIHKCFLTLTADETPCP